MQPHAASRAKPASAGRRSEPPAIRFGGTPMAFVEQGPQAVIDSVRGGLPYEAVVTLADRLGLARERLVALIGLPKSTLKARQTAAKPLSAVEGDRLVRVANAYRRACDVLEDDEAAKRWLARENRTIGGVAPLSLMDTEAGYQLVLDTLGRIEHGVVA